MEWNETLRILFESTVAGVTASLVTGWLHGRRVREVEARNERQAEMLTVYGREKASLAKENDELKEQLRSLSPFRGEN
jgi:hypothetical protein